MSRIRSVTASQAISLLIRSSPYSHGMKGSDERDAMFARLFGLTAIIQSGALFATTISISADFLGVVSQLVKLGQAKAWLRESAWWTLLGGLERLLDSEVEWKTEALEGLVERVFINPEWNQEKVALAVLLERRRPVSLS